LADIKPGFDVILLVAKPAVILGFDEKKKKLRSTLYRAKMV
jgi:hypothetical protein